MAKVRVQLFCHGCEAFLDSTLHASKVDRVVAGFKTAHPAKCFEEDPRGSNEEGAASGATEAGEGPTDGAKDRAEGPIH